FKKVTESNSVLHILTPAELKALVEGQGDVPVRLLDLKPHCRLVGFEPSDSVIQDLWSVLASFDQKTARSFLVFLTGSSGVPIQGLKGMQMTIQRSGDDPERLPASHTCAAVLD